MGKCDKDHEPVEFEGPDESCPICAIVKELEDLSREADELRTEIADYSEHHV